MIRNKKMLSIIEHCLNVLYHLFFFFFKRGMKKNLVSRKYYFCICAIFKNEARYLKEWIEYHKLIGVEHIFLYNNNSTDDFMSVLTPYINNNFVTLKEWPMEYGQIDAYKDCFESHRNDTVWISFIDIDEFIYSKRFTDIKDWLKQYEGYPAICIYWQMFGTNGHIEPDFNQLLIERYTHAWRNLDGIGKYILSTQSAFEPTKINVHHIYCKYLLCGFTMKIPMITEHRKFIFFPQIYKVPKHNTVQLNHYWSKSLNEYLAKVKKGDVNSHDFFELRQKSSFFYAHEHNNTCENKEIWRFLIELKLRMANIDIFQNNLPKQHRQSSVISFRKNENITQ